MFSNFWSFVFLSNPNSFSTYRLVYAISAQISGLNEENFALTSCTCATTKDLFAGFSLGELFHPTKIKIISMSVNCGHPTQKIVFPPSWPTVFLPSYLSYLDSVLHITVSWGTWIWWVICPLADPICISRWAPLLLIMHHWVFHVWRSN
jgi:hypothetical protein